MQPAAGRRVVEHVMSGVNPQGVQVVDTPGKEWKFNADDVAERASWDDYMQAFDDALTATSTPWAPWYVAPADRKWLCQALVAQILVETIRSLEIAWPEVSAAEHAANMAARQLLEAES
jgi:Polyphosphate kinase 2 (PPK2)